MPDPRGASSCRAVEQGRRLGPADDYAPGVSTSVVLSVTPREPIDPERFTGELPDDIAAALTASRQRLEPGLWCPRNGRVRFLFQLSGPDRVAAGRRLVAEVRRLGYEADLSFSP